MRQPCDGVSQDKHSYPEYPYSFRAFAGMFDLHTSDLKFTTNINQNSLQMDTNERICKIREHFCGGNNKVFAEVLGFSTQFASNITKSGKNVGDKTLDNILSKFPSVNPVWLKMGVGEMLKSGNGSDKDMNGYRMVPVYNFDVVGGMDSWAQVVDSPAYIEKLVPFTGAAQGDICVHVTGNSMMPTYSAGSLLLIRKVEGWKEYFGYGHCYVLLLRDGRRILKEVRKSEVDSKTHVLCVSFNPQNDPEELPRDFIADVYKVIATLTNEGY